ncbi:MAG: N-6 DNA methylase [Proteobacteria bacterium]|nr:N-6 DNA methylase [Pseudomonadota bacterium]
MKRIDTTQWLNKLGYDPSNVSLPGSGVGLDSPYAREINRLLDPEAICASAVVTMDEHPVVCFIDSNGRGVKKTKWLDKIRKKIWNQSLVSLILVIDDDELTAFPVNKKSKPDEKLKFDSAGTSSQYSMADINTGEIQKRHPDWFDPENNVDQVLLSNLKQSITKLKTMGASVDDAQYLMGQCLFVSYLEHREIVSDEYRNRRGVEGLHSLISARNGKGLEKLFLSLKKNFNGDFFELREKGHSYWTSLSDEVFSLLDDFLNRVDLNSGQLSFWGYDFRYIPVEMISGIYETFLGDDKGNIGAYYTPRHLANLTIDQAFGESKDITKEVVFDGACGSGILLTTAFRRIVLSSMSKGNGDPSFRERIDLLLKCIRGSDINQSACRITVFSLYLALLEDIQPKDIARLQDDEKIKLPKLLGEIIVCGENDGDFFNKSHKFITGSKNTILVSNPPWYEAKGYEKNTSFELWAQSNEKELVRRQIACAFAHRSCDAVIENGRVCLILPASILTASTSQAFVSQLLTEIEVDRVINFSDIRRLLFAKAIHPCVVISGKVKSGSNYGVVKSDEFCDYWVPKADVSLAFGRLTVHSSDRHRILTQDIYFDNEILRVFFWGSQKDHSLISKLRIKGQINDLVSQKDSRWTICKGFHQTDRSKEPLPPGKLKAIPFLDSRKFPKQSPILDRDILEEFPDSIVTVADYGSKSGAAFSGPRVLFPDGATNNFEVKALFTNIEFCFKQTISAIVGPSDDSDILRFLTIYLRSKLASYVLFHTAYSLASERPHIKLIEIRDLPFVLPEDHSDPQKAKKIVTEVSKKVKALNNVNVFEFENKYRKLKSECEKLIFEYFGLDYAEQSMVNDTFEYLLPSVQPNAYNKIKTPLYYPVSESDIDSYSHVLLHELNEWRAKLGGKGKIKIETIYDDATLAYTLGIVKLSISSTSTISSFTNDNSDVMSILTILRNNNVLPMQIAHGNYHLGSDFLIHAGEHIYLIKPLVKRLWLKNQAVHDAQRIVTSIQTNLMPENAR